MNLMRHLPVSLISLLLLLTTACAHHKAVLNYHEPQRQVWPVPPAQPRYAFVGYLIGESNFKIGKQQRQPAFFEQFMTKLGHFFIGETPPMQLSRPQSGVVDNVLQRIYITDVGCHCVFVFDQREGELYKWEFATEEARFVTPVGIALADDQHIYVSDADLGLVVELNQAGEFQRQLGSNLFGRPTGVAYDAKKGRLYVADTQHHDIKVLDRQGEWLTTLGQKGDQASEFNAPTHLAFQDDKLFVTDTLNSRVQIFTAEGEFVKKFGRRGMYVGDMPRPKGVAVDQQAQIYIVESYYDYLLVYDSEGHPLLPIGGSGHGVGQFSLPAGVWTDTQNQIFIADMLNSRVVVIKHLTPSVGERGVVQDNNVAQLNEFH